MGKPGFINLDMATSLGEEKLFKTIFVLHRARGWGVG